MSLLQDPVKALDQIEWYLDNLKSGKFPNAHLLAAGNLARQVLEQILFILAFYGRLPRQRYMKTNNQLRDAGRILRELNETDANAGLTYFEVARRRGLRIRKFARYPRTLEKWRKQMNEPSHFSNPMIQRKIKEHHIRDFVNHLRSIFDFRDAYLITAAVNEICSKGLLQAVLNKNSDNTPGILITKIVTPQNLKFENGKFTFTSGQFPIKIIPATYEIPRRWGKNVIIIQHSHGMSLNYRLITKGGHPVDFSSLQGIINTFARDPKDRKHLIRRLKQLGFKTQVTKSNSSIKSNSNDLNA